jgi:heme oxygenase
MTLTSGAAPAKMKSFGALHRLLRSATRSDFMVIERMTSQFDLARREDYGLFLNAHYWALSALSPHWRESDRGDFLRIAECLQGDLHALGFAASNPHPALDSSMTADHGFGISFVIRGACLGSSALRDRVPPHFAAGYFDFSPALSWPRFLQQLEQHVVERSEQDRCPQVISGAKHALAVISGGLRLSLG